ncbi:MAG: hypothetical protein II203_02160, partial [Phascolarctobacterium sp.]|nr:hypothetical protein [Phascolarctobacterium sp.]
FNPVTALKISREMEQYNPMLMEEPCPPDYVDTPEVWAMLVADKDKAVNDATGIKAQSSALEANRMRQTAVDSFKDYMKAADAPKEIEKSKKALEDSFAKSYKESDYTPENWQVLLNIKAEALNAMDKAVKKSELTQIAADAEKAFKAVEKAEK